MHTEQHGNGQNLVLLHGWGLNSGVWRPMLNSLTQDFRLTLIDLPGFGHNHQILPEHYHLDSVAEMVAPLIPDNSVVLGWSLGGLVAQQLALDYNDKVEALITLASTPKFMAGDNWQGIQAKVLSAFQQQLQFDFTKTLDRFLAIQAMGSESPKEDIRTIKQHIQAYPQANPAALANGLQILKDADLRTRLKQIEQPTLRLYGRLDSLVPVKVIEEIGLLQPRATQVVLQRASHAPFISHQQQTSDAINQWWRGL